MGKAEVVVFGVFELAVVVAVTGAVAVTLTVGTGEETREEAEAVSKTDSDSTSTTVLTATGEAAVTLTTLTAAAVGLPNDGDVVRWRYEVWMSVTKLVLGAWVAPPGPTGKVSMSLTRAGRAGRPKSSMRSMGRGSRLWRRPSIARSS